MHFLYLMWIYFTLLHTRLYIIWTSSLFINHLHIFFFSYITFFYFIFKAQSWGVIRQHNPLPMWQIKTWILKNSVTLPKIYSFALSYFEVWPILFASYPFRDTWFHSSLWTNMQFFFSVASSRHPLMEDPLNLSLSNGVLRSERRLLFFDLLCLCLPLFSDCLCIFFSLHTQPHSSLKASGARQSHFPPPSFHRIPSSSSTSPISSQGWGLPSGLLSIRQFLWKALRVKRRR